MRHDAGVRRLYDISLLLLFTGILIAGGGAGFGSTLAFRVGMMIVAVAVTGVLVYAFRPKGRKTGRA